MLLVEADAAATAVPIRPLALLAAIGAALPANAVLVEETISSGRGLHRLLRTDDPQSFFGLCGGGIGWGLLVAVGVKLVLFDRLVVVLVGDGSVLYII